MKNPLTKLFIFIFASLIFFSSCDLSVKFTPSAEKKYSTVYFSIADFENSSARSVVMPKEYVVGQYKFKLYANAYGSNDKIYIHKDLVDYSTLTDSSNPFSLAYGEYSFTLEAYVNFDSKDCLIAQAYKLEILSSASTNLNFVLEPVEDDDIPDAERKGNLSFTGTFKDNNVNSITVVTYNNPSMIPSAKVNETTFNASNFTIDAESGNNQFIYAGLSLEPGYYFIQFNFYNSALNLISSRFASFKILTYYTTEFKTDFGELALYKTYSITYKDYSDNEYTGTNASTIYVSTKDSSITLETPMSSVAGAIFEGWYTDSSCAPEYKISNSLNPQTFTKNITVYANWLFENVYVDPSSGDDRNAGYFSDKAFYSVAEAKKHLGPNSKNLYVKNQITDENDIAALSGISTPIYGNAVVKRYKDMTQNPIIYLDSDAIIQLSDVTFDGGAIWNGASAVDSLQNNLTSGVEAKTPLICVHKGSLDLTDNVIIQNNNNVCTSADEAGINCYGGGIFVGGTGSLNIENSTVKIQSNASKMYGGGITINTKDGVVSLSEAVISDNYTAADGGGIYLYRYGTLALNGMYNTTVIRENYAGGNGGGIALAGCIDNAGSEPTVTIGYTEIVSNTAAKLNADANGGGIYCTGKYSSLMLGSGTKISENTATNGGGIYLAAENGFEPKLTLINAKVLDNFAKSHSNTGSNGVLGAGIASFNGNLYLMTGSEISGNKFINSTDLEISGKGSGIYNNGSLEIDNNVAIASPDNIYLEDTKYIVAAVMSTYEVGKEIDVVPSKYEEGIRILTLPVNKQEVRNGFKIVQNPAEPDVVYSIDTDGLLINNSSSSGSFDIPEYLNVTFEADKTSVLNSTANTISLTAYLDGSEIPGDSSNWNGDWSINVYSAGNDVTSDFTISTTGHTVIIPANYYPGLLQIIVTGKYKNLDYTSTLFVTVEMDESSSGGSDSGSSGSAYDYRPTTSAGNNFEIVETQVYYQTSISDLKQDSTISYIVSKIKTDTGNSSLESVTLSFPSDTTEALIHKIFSQSGAGNSLGVNMVLDLTKVDIEEFTEDLGNNSYVTSVYLPNNLKSIKESMFSSWTKLEKVTIPDSVTTINKSAFMGCTSLQDVVLSKNVTELSSQCFAQCSSLEKILIPASVTHLSTQVFMNCSSSLKIYFEDVGSFWYSTSTENGEYSAVSGGGTFTVADSTTDYYSTMKAYAYQHWYKQN